VANGTQFVLAYDGEGPANGNIYVEDLAPALLGLQDLVEEANRVATGGQAQVTLRIRAEFRRGSFAVDLDVIERVLRTAVDVFSGQNATAVANLLGILGISGAVGIFQLVKRSKGKHPRRAIEITETRSVRVEFEGGDPIEVDAGVWRLFRNPRARSAIAKVAKPLTKPDIDTVKFLYDGRETFIATDDDAKALGEPDLREGELVRDSERVLQIVAMSFREDNKWRVSEGGSTYFVMIRDEDFLHRIQIREELFGANDYLRVLLRTRQWTENGALRVSREVIEVLAHSTSAEQMPLLFDDEDIEPTV
jgi:hypothetical protein